MSAIESQAESWSPVIITVYDRPEHFRETITSLAKNEGASKTVLYISSDGPKNPQAKARVEEVRREIATITGFRDVIVWAPEINTNGEVRDQLIRHVSRTHESYLFSEDDNVFSPFFLRFVNDGLREFGDDPRVRAVCGYLYPGVSFPGNHQVSLKCFTPWGYGTWSNRGHSDTAEILARKTLEDRTTFADLNEHLPHLPRLNRRVLTENLRAEDAHITNEIFLNNQFCIFPPRSLVRNIGNDNSGLNSKRDLRFQEQEIETAPVVIDRGIPIVPNSMNSRKIRNFHGGSLVRFFNYAIYLEFSSHFIVGRLFFGLVNPHAIRAAGALRFAVRALSNLSRSLRVANASPNPVTELPELRSPR